MMKDRAVNLEAMPLNGNYIVRDTRTDRCLVKAASGEFSFKRPEETSPESDFVLCMFSRADIDKNFDFFCKVAAKQPD